jgi:hypothetical protein
MVNLGVANDTPKSTKGHLMEVAFVLFRLVGGTRIELVTPTMSR